MQKPYYVTVKAFKNAIKKRKIYELYNQRNGPLLYDEGADIRLDKAICLGAGSAEMVVFQAALADVYNKPNVKNRTQRQSKA